MHISLSTKFSFTIEVQFSSFKSALVPINTKPFFVGNNMNSVPLAYRTSRLFDRVNIAFIVCVCFFCFCVKKNWKFKSRHEIGFC